jgi:outer membrane protein TolC
MLMRLEQKANHTSTPLFMRRLASVSLLLLLSAGSLLITSCTGTFHKKWADREVFGILKKKAAKVPNAGEDILNVDPPAPLSLDQLSQNTKTVDFLGDRAGIEKQAKVLKLPDALQYSVHRNRDYLGRKEELYVSALDLTLARHVHAPILIGTGNATQTSTRVEGAVNEFVTESTLTNTGALGLSALARTGARLAVDLTTDFTKFITGGMTKVSNSRLAVTLTQPLLRGAGVLAASEPLTQAERSTLYAIRDFTQYRKTFAVDTTSAYYQTLQARDTAKNAHIAYKAFKGIVEREEAMVDANQRSRSSLGQLQQAELTYNRRWISAIKNYEEALDNLKITLGLPVTAKFMLDQNELDQLQLMEPPGTLEESLETALATRLDLWNQRDTLIDAERRVKVAKQDLLPGVNLILGGSMVGDPGADGANLDSSRRQGFIGADVDLNLDQKPLRNNLRLAMLDEQAARRTLELAEENVRREIRTAWRNLDVARKQYNLAQIAVKLSERRLLEEEAFMLEDRGTARDLIDAQQDLIEARDLLTAALIAHTIARLQLWKDMGILFIRKDGRWADVLKGELPRGTPNP